MENSDLDLTPAMQEMMAEMAAMRAELNDLKQRANVITPPQLEQSVKPVVSTTRRTALRRLAGGLLAGLTVGSVAASTPQTAQASFVRSGGAGAVVMRPGGTVSGNLPSRTFYGLIASPDTTLNIGNFSDGFTAGVLGVNSGQTNYDYGLFGTGFTGVYGSGVDNGVTGESYGGSGVYGHSTGGGYGVSGISIGGGYGVFGNTTGNGTGVYGASDSGYSGDFSGKVYIGGPLEKPSGSFKIDHPLDPAGKYLYHSFVESPDMMNIYNGIVTLDGQGEATVTMPDWFDALNSDFRYQLTSIGVSMPDIFIAGELKERTFKIGGGKSGERVSWMVTGIRQDEWAKAHRIQVEEDKIDNEKGKYLHPELFGQPEEMSVHPRPKIAK